jgi:hypothetical protein
MSISIAQLIVGFKSAMTTQGLADHLGIPELEVRARIAALTSDEESTINKEMSGQDGNHA